MENRTPTYLIFGKLRREFLITPSNKVIADQPGGCLLYAAEGVGLWLEADQKIGLIARVGEDYPRDWLDMLEENGYLIDGIKVLPEEIDLRYFRAYTDLRTYHHDDPVSHFTKRGLTMPKSLLGYQPLKPPRSLREVLPTSLRQSDFPESYTGARAAHLTGLDFLSHTITPPYLRQQGVQIVTLDPGPYMHKENLSDVKSMVIGLTAFLPSEDQLGQLFLNQTTDLREMIEEVATWGVEIVVVKRAWQGQMVYHSVTNKCYEIPAYPSKMVDPTGAGDVFAGGFLAGLMITGSPTQAVLYGNVSASFAVEGSGVFYTQDALPGLQQARLESIRDSIRVI
ncbi:MAG: carbohydrate kinase family protein [Anaerolineales bacterium]